MSKIKMIEINGAWYAFNQSARAVLRATGLEPNSGYLILGLVVAHLEKHDYVVERVAYKGLKEVSLEAKGA